MIIIGGGIAGISLGRALSQRGHHVTLLEAEDQLAYHTSGRSAQQLVLGYGPDAVQELTDHTVKMLLEQQQALQNPVVWPSQFMTVGTPQEIADHAYPGQVHQEASDVARLLPELDPTRFSAGALDDRSLRTDAPAMIQWLVDDAEHLNIRLGETVTAAQHKNNQWHITTNATTYTATTVINAAGAWADHIAKIFDATQLGLTPLRRTAAILEIDTQIDAKRCMMLKPDGYYYRYESDTTILASPSEAVPSPAQDAKPYPEDIAELIQNIETDTSFRILNVQAAWTGLRTEAPDGVPVIGYDATPGFFWLAGQSGYGFQTSLACARLAADLILDAAPETWLSTQSINALSPERFR